MRLSFRWDDCWSNATPQAVCLSQSTTVWAPSFMLTPYNSTRFTAAILTVVPSEIFFVQWPTQKFTMKMDINLEIVLKIICVSYDYFYWLMCYDWAFFVSYVSLLSKLINLSVAFVYFLGRIKIYFCFKFSLRCVLGLFVTCLDYSLVRVSMRWIKFEFIINWG